MYHRTIRRTSCALPLLLFAMPAMAKFNGCYWLADGNYQLGQTAQVTVSNAMPPGTVVRDEVAYGDGNRLAKCAKGYATLEGDYTVAREGGMVPLTVGGQPSGFGIEVYIHELRSGQHYDFPHRYQRYFGLGEGVVSNDAVVGYRITRIGGPVRFGRVDSRVIAQQWSYQPEGGRTRAFRYLTVYDLQFVRPTCSVSAETLNQVFDVGTYHVGNFATPERATPWRPFHLTVQECAEPVGLVASFTFGNPADADPTVRELFSLSGPRNVGLELASDDTRTTIQPGVPFLANALGTGKSYDFNVRLRETGSTVRGGAFRRPIVVQVDFN